MKKVAPARANATSSDQAEPQVPGSFCLNTYEHGAQSYSKHLQLSTVGEGNLFCVRKIM